MKPGIIVMSELRGPLADRVLEIQRRFDPRLGALGQAPHVTLVGSSGMGPIHPDTTRDELLERLAPIAADTAPIALRFGRPTRFMQTQIVVLPLDPHGPLRTLHERIRTAGFRSARPRFYFTPHVTLSLHRELPPDLLATLLRERFDEPVTIDSIEAHLTKDTGESRLIVRLSLGARSAP